jgi:adenosine deaminase CECR1
MVGADGEDNLAHREMLMAFEEVINEIKDELKKRGQENKFIGARVKSTHLHPLCRLLMSAK